MTLTNPIDYSAYANKEIILDVKVELNNEELLDIELQMYQQSIWEKRSLLYLCRSFDSIGVGDEYNLLKPTTLIAILDGSPFREDPEFYAHYQLLNVRNFKPYSTLLNINVLYLNQTKIATDKEIEHGLVNWAKLFQATTWEEIRELCTERPVFEEVAKVMYNVNASDSERTIYEAHRKFVMDKVSWRSAGYREAKAEDQAKIDGLNAKVENLSAENEDLSARNEDLSAENARLLEIIYNAGLSDKL